jgi:hypothetical protein
VDEEAHDRALRGSRAAASARVASHLFRADHPGHDGVDRLEVRGVRGHGQFHLSAAAAAVAVA